MTLVWSKEVTLDPHSWSSERWIVLCNTVLLFLVTVFCCMVLFEIQSLDQKFISVIDSSRIAIDLMNVDIVEPHFQPFWRDVNEHLKVYSAFYDSEKRHVLIIGSSVHSDVFHKDIRCLVQYEDGDISLEEVDFRKKAECSTTFVYCFLEKKLLPLKVSLISLDNTIPKQWINVEVIPVFQPNKPSNQAADCVHPLTENLYPQALKKFITARELSGTKEFYIYYRNVSNEILDSLLDLTFKGHFVHILKWTEEENSTISNKCWLELNEFVQDCSHRSLGKHKYLNIVHTGTSIKDLYKMVTNIPTKNLTDIANY